MNNTLSILGQMAKAQELDKEKNTKENPGYHPPGNLRGGNRGGGKRGAREGPRVPVNHRQGQLGKTTRRTLSMASSKQCHASLAAAKGSKRRKKSSQDSASDCEEASDSEYQEFAHQARPEELRLGTRAKIATEEEDM
jgi:hypothetical protein